MVKQDFVEAFVEARFDRLNAVKKEAKHRKVNQTREADARVLDRKDASRRMWEAAFAALTEEKAGETSIALDREIADWLASNIHSLLVNRTPEDIRDIKKRGKPKTDWAVDDAIKTAVTYHCYLEALGKPAPTKHISRLFSVDRDTVREWKRQFSQNLWDCYRPTLDEAVRIRALRISVKRARLIYSKESQSNKSIAIRDKRKA